MSENVVHVENLILGQKLVRLRKMRGNMSQGTLAQKAGYAGHGIISKIETGKRAPSRARLAKIAKALEVQEFILSTPIDFTDQELYILANAYKAVLDKNTQALDMIENTIKMAEQLQLAKKQK